MLSALREKNPRAEAWLDQIPKAKWAQSYDEGRRYGHMTTNLAECFNGVLKGSRARPITALVRSTYYRLNSWFVDHRNEAVNMIKAGHVYSEELTNVYGLEFQPTEGHNKKKCPYRMREVSQSSTQPNDDDE
ncbi:hypothetical protein Lal_00044701 [Lupinus albus]|nr:hypothetical protein Lal_00044701 [Lupinus albus]